MQTRKSGKGEKEECKEERKKERTREKDRI